MADRDEKGRFVKGWKGGPGRLSKAREERYYEIALQAVPFKQWCKIIERAAKDAEKGDAAARRFLADYLLGRPTQEVKLDARSDMAIMLQWGDADDNDSASTAPQGTEGGPDGEGQIQSPGGWEAVGED